MSFYLPSRKNRSTVRILLISFLWLTVMGWYLHREILPSLASPEPPLPSLNDALAATSGEEWLGIFYGGKQVGYSHTFIYPVREEGLTGTKLENTIQLELPFPGRSPKVRIRTLGFITPDGNISRLKVVGSSTTPPLEIEAEMVGDEIKIRITGGEGERRFSLPLPRPSLPAYLVATLLPRQIPQPGESFSVLVLDPLSGLTGDSPKTEAIGFRVIENNSHGSRLRADYRGIAGELLLDPEGKVRKITTDLGWSLERQSLSEVTDFLARSGKSGEQAG